MVDGDSIAHLNRNVVEMVDLKSHRTFAVNESEENVVLVDDQDQPIGIESKTRAHKDGVLHRAFSVFVLNAFGHLLMQRRAVTKYHSRGLWSNTCCGHPRPGETIQEASRRRLREEMGFESDLTEVFDFIYHANLEDGLIEHEYDHVLFGWFDGAPKHDPAEVAEWRWMDTATLNLDLKAHPENYTYWLRLCFDRFLQVISSPKSIPAAGNSD